MSRARTSIVRIADLRAPKLDAAQQVAIDYVATLDLDLDEHRLLAEARNRARCDDFGDSGFLVRLRAMIDAVQADTGLGPIGLLAIRQRTVRLLTSRLLLEDLVRRHPEILDIDLVAPIIVIGLPRSGTTHLVNLIASDTRLRSLPYWESPRTVPAPRRRPGSRRRRPPLRALPARLRGPDADGAADTGDAPSVSEHIEEEIELEDLDFASYMLEWLCRPPLARLLPRARPAPALRVHEEGAAGAHVLRGPNRWVLKSPQHLEQMPALLDDFPDATFVITHRDPVSVIQSTITMLGYGDRMRRSQIELDGLAQYWVDRVEKLLGACVRDRDLLPADAASTCCSTSSWPTTSAWSRASTSAPDFR